MWLWAAHFREKERDLGYAGILLFGKLRMRSCLFFYFYFIFLKDETFQRLGSYNCTFHTHSNHLLVWLSIPQAWKLKTVFSESFADRISIYFKLPKLDEHKWNVDLQSDTVLFLDPILCWIFNFFFLKMFIYLFMWETQPGRDTGRGRSRLHAGSLMGDSISGLQDHNLSRTKDRRSTAEPPRRPWIFNLKARCTCVNPTQLVLLTNQTPQCWDRNFVLKKFFRRFWWAKLVKNSSSTNPRVRSNISTLDPPKEIFFF